MANSTFTQPPHAPFVTKAPAVSVTGGAPALGTVSGGRVIIRSLIGTVSTVIGATLTTIRIVATPTVGSGTALCAQSADIANAAVGSLFSLTGDLADTLVMTSSQGAVASMVNPIIVAPGVIDRVIVSGGTTGAIDWFIEWIPLDAGASLV